MFHKENNTLDLLGQFSQNTQKTNHNEDDKDKMMLRDLGQFITTSETRRNTSSFGMSSLIWYAITGVILIFLFREIFFINKINDFSDVVSTVNKAVTEGTHKATEEIEEIQKAAHNASQNTHTKKEENK